MTETALLLRRQWDVLRAWLETERVLDRAAEPSGLGGWTVADLVVHLGYGLRMVAEVTPATDQHPIDVGRYVAGYVPAQEQIATDTSVLATSLQGEELAGIDALAAQAWQALEVGLPPVVLGRRGPLRSDDFLLTRLLELVAHGDDLHRLLGPDRTSPLLPAAVDRVAAVLADAYQQATGRPAGWTGLDLVRAATGRTATDDPALPLLS
ncbi:maleylpyruvate isomerase N-terminal domain-containing protein [Nocardioides sp. TF02-7]|uniref:maleylpyruvate isomerase N-terminal domain-containing protein n=1 Tax=Nocardioides sp. TF02-7 TaxID=2917724 RepID=UPI001F068C82|nr:maleylpyruvate isomerase N-terminal domain-containing protein [Nocardioides sp. TF02-7]UMG94398.1 maleylpyruvate isomerase N-terminal domain-containing protein [Nocardioides sp. TF02-7]